MEIKIKFVEEKPLSIFAACKKILIVDKGLKLEFANNKIVYFPQIKNRILVWMTDNKTSFTIIRFTGIDHLMEIDEEICDSKGNTINWWHNRVYIKKGEEELTNLEVKCVENDSSTSPYEIMNNIITSRKN